MAMLIKTKSSGIVWVDWPPVEDADVWCRGSAPDGGDATVYRLVDGAWVPGDWENVNRATTDRGELH
jgi:hypothetical protein